MSVSTVSSSSILWEEYLARLRQTSQQKQSAGSTTYQSATTSAEPSIAPLELLAELQSLLENTEELKARAAEMAAEVRSAAEVSTGKSGSILKSLAEDLENVAISGDLAALREKLEGGRPRGPNAAGTTGVGGGHGLAAKSLWALLEEEEEEEDDSAAASSLKALIAQLQELLRSIEDEEPDSDIALAPDETLEDETLAASGGDSTVLQENLEIGRAGSPRRHGGFGKIQPATTDETDVASVSIENLVAKLRKLKEENAADASATSNIEDTSQTGENTIDELLASITANLSKQLRSLYSQGSSLPSTVTLSA
ncbi:MAG: hypothetical protein LBT31_05635 [Synergistaceae bacterium]|nr:hypothetical protein [Synergistaceae bacterium]